MSPRAVASLAAALLVVSVAATAAAQASDPQDRYRTVVHARPRRDREQVIVITARELAERGIDNLAEALDLVPQLGVRQGGRGDVRVDVRGAKQRSVMVLVDGAPMDEPYFGAFDLASIPVTDIAEIRISLSPASPLEGPGGDGGIVDVITLRAVGNRRIDARLRLSDQPDGQGAVTGRTPIVGGLAIRGSAGGRYGAQDFTVVNPDGSAGTLGEPQHQAHGAVRLEEQTRSTLTSVDGWISHRSFWSPPNEQSAGEITYVQSDLDARLVAGTQFVRGGLRLAAGVYSQWISRRTEYYGNSFSLLRPFNVEQLDANRTGGAVHGDYNLGRQWQLSARASVDTEDATVTSTIAKPGKGRTTLAEVAAGALWHWRWFRADASVGVAAPLGDGPSPWPEAKLVVSWDPNQWIELRATGARKGRVPTLRERFDPLTGNPDLQPEQTWHGELAMLVKAHSDFVLRATGYVRRTDGLIQLDAATRTRSVNLSDVRVYGLETGVDIARARPISAGVTYVFEEAYQDDIGLDAINNFPRHKIDGWLSARYHNLGGALVRARYVGSRIDQNVELPAFYQVDLSAWARLSRNLRATLLMENLTDNRYEERAGVRSLGRIVSLAVEGTWE